jgi:hypothetical protein
MKDFDNPIPLTDEIKIVAQKQFEKQKAYWSSQVLYKGHTMFEINCQTGEIIPAEYKSERIEFVDEYDIHDMMFSSLTGKKPQSLGKIPKKVKDIDCKENCLYVPALNLKTARIKFIKHLMATGKIIK